MEEKIKLHEDSTLSSSESVTDLKREIARHKDAEERSTQYIADLEARLTRSDESVLTLRATVEKLENDGQARREEVEVLQARLNGILNDGESWRSDLEERERRVKDLEAKLEEWEAKKKEAGQDRTRLDSINTQVGKARRSLELDLAHVKAAKEETTESPVIFEENNDEPLESQLHSLRETHAATLADLSSVTSKYRDALKEISDLAGQINEIKLSSPSSRSASPERSPVDVPLIRRRFGSQKAKELGDIQVNGSGKRLFFRQAASAESLHAR